MRNQRKALQTQMALAFKEGKKGLSQLVNPKRALFILA